MRVRFEQFQDGGPGRLGGAGDRRREEERVRHRGNAGCGQQPGGGRLVAGNSVRHCTVQAEIIAEDQVTPGGILKR